MHILTANEEGQPLQVIGKLHHLDMVVSHTLILNLHHIMVVRNLSHLLNLGGYFLREFDTRVCFDMQQPCIWIRGEFVPLRGVPATRAKAEKEQGYEGPLPGPLPEPPHVIEKGTNCVETALNDHQEANLLAMSLPPDHGPPSQGLPSAYSEIASLPEA